MLSKKRDNVTDIISEGIELLKNRGYDSAGIATLENNEGSVRSHLIKYADSDTVKNGNCI